MKTQTKGKSNKTKSKTFGMKTVVNLVATEYMKTKSIANQLIQDVIRFLFETTIEDGKLRLPNGYGTLKVKKSKARVARNPQTGESVNVPAKTKITFRQGKTLKTMLS